MLPPWGDAAVYLSRFCPECYSRHIEKSPVGQMDVHVGQVVFTATLMHTLMEKQGLERGDVLGALLIIMSRHINKDWGDVDAEDWLANDRDLVNGERLLSVYRVFGERVYVITEWDRSYTTIMLPEDY